MTETINQEMRRVHAEADFFTDYLAAGIPEDTAAVLARHAAAGTLGNAKVDTESVEREIAAHSARLAALVCERFGRFGCSLHRDHLGDCVKLCAVHPFRPIDDDGESVTIAPVYARFGHLCGPCYGRARHNLQQAPQLLAHIRSQVVPSMESARGPRVSGSREAPIPLRPDPVDDADDLYAQLVNWIVSFARQTGVRPPASAVAFLNLDADAVRLPSWARDQASAYTLADDLVRWYEQHETTIVSKLPPLTVKAWCEDIGTIVGAFRSRYPQADRKPRQAKARECPTCGEHAMHAEFYAAGVQVECAHCGEIIPEDQHDQYVDWAEKTPMRAISLACDRGKHHICGWIDCPCDCHERKAA